MRELLDLLKAGLNQPEDLAFHARTLPPNRFYLWDCLLLVILSGVILAISAIVRGGFQAQLILILPLSALLTGTCGLIGYIWAVNSKGEATLYQTTIATPFSLFFPTLATIALLTVDRLLIIPAIAGGATIWLQLLDLVSGLLGPLYGWLMFYLLLRKLHNLKGKYAAGASLMAVFMTVVVAYFLGSLL